MCKRALGSWPIWVAAAAIVSGSVTLYRATRPPRYKVTSVLRVSEGPLRAPGQLGQGALYDHVRELTFTRARLGELMQRHPAEFPGAAADPEAAFQNMRDDIAVSITDSDLIDERSDSDPPRSARIAISYTSSKREVAWQITGELTDLLIGSALARQRAVLLRERTAADSEVERAEEGVEDASLQTEATRTRLRAADERASAAKLGLRATDDQQSLRFELVDPGALPPIAGKASFVVDFLAMFAIALVVGWLLTGAFDPRVLQADDLRALGFPVLGELPSLPGAPSWDSTSQAASSNQGRLPSDISRPSV